MQLADVLCYIVLTITVTTSCARAEEQYKEVEQPQDDRNIRKREATLIMDINGIPMDKIFQKPKVIYRRLSKSRFGPQNTKYGSPQTEYGPPRPTISRPRKGTRKPGKKGRRTGKPKTTSPKYGPPESNHKHNTFTNNRVSKHKSKYGVPNYRTNSRPRIGHIVKTPHYSFFAPVKSGFGEPPAYMLEQQTQKQSYGEPPVDSYGVPLKPSIQKAYPTPHSFQNSSPHDKIHDNKKQKHQWNHKYANSDSSYAFTKKEPSYSNFVTPTPKDSPIHTLDPVLNEQKLQDNKFFFRNKRPFYFADSKVVNRQESNKQDDLEDDIIVGGQYAEPPARYVPKYRQNSMMYEEADDEDSFTNLQGYVDADYAESVNNSPYLNYKHSNMAFSPQNLNDAFSILDK